MFDSPIQPKEKCLIHQSSTVIDLGGIGIRQSWAEKVLSLFNINYLLMMKPAFERQFYTIQVRKFQHTVLNPVKIYFIFSSLIIFIPGPAFHLTPKNMLHPFDPKTRRKFFGLNKINYPKNNIINFYTNLKYVCMFNNQIKYKSGLKKLLIKQSQINILLIVFLLFVNIV